MTGKAASDFRIKLLVVHPDGRRQKFLVTFPERRSLKIDQRYIGLPLTLRVDFVPGEIICRPGTGHTLSVANKLVREHVLNVNDIIGLDQYSIEFLELPEPLPMEDATRVVNINDVSEKTVIAPMAMDHDQDQDRDRQPAYSQRHSEPPPRVPEQQGMRRPDPEDSTAVIRRLQVPGSTNTNTNNYATLQPTSRSGNTVTNSRVTANTGRNQDSSFHTNTGFTSGGQQGNALGPAPAMNEDPGNAGVVSFSKKHIAFAAIALAAITAYMYIGKGIHLPTQPATTELASESGLTEEAPPDSPSTEVVGEMKPMELPTSAPSSETTAAPATGVVPPPAPIIPSPQNVSQQAPAAPMGVPRSLLSELPFDDKSGFDPMAIDQFFDAVDAGDETRIKELLDKRQVDVNLSRRRGYAALHPAAARGDLATVKFLSRMKADPNVLDGSGATPLMWAVFRRHSDVAKFLAPKTNIKITRQGGETAYDLAKRIKLKGLLSMLNPDQKKGKKDRVPTSLPDKRKKK